MNELNLLKEVVLTAESVGVERTIKSLQRSREEVFRFENRNVDKVLEAVCSVTSLTREEVLHGTGRKNGRKYAIGFFTYFLYHEFGYMMKDIQRYTNKNKSALTRYRADIEHIIQSNLKQFKDVRDQFSAILNIIKP